MFCINCFHKKTNVVNSRGHKKQPQIWRRRSCRRCGFTFTTYENFALDELLLVQTSHKDEPYNRGKLLASLIEALNPSGDDLSKAYWLVITIEEKLLLDQQNNAGWQKVSSQHIAEITYETLLAYNTAAGYIYGAKHGVADMDKKTRRGRHPKS